MKKILLLVMIAFSLVLVWCGSKGWSSWWGDQDTSKVVQMKDYKFEPSEITIMSGETVKWQNDDDAPHNVISTEWAFNSPKMNKWDTYTFKFDKVGEYTYFCDFHQNMKGKVIVK